MKTFIVPVVLAIAATTLLDSCAGTSSSAPVPPPTAAQAELGCRMVLDKSLWGEPEPWSYCDQIGGMIPRAMMELSHKTPQLTDSYSIKGDKPLLGKATLVTLESKYGAADRVTKEDGFTVHHYGWFGFGTKDGGKTFGCLSAPMIFYVKGIQKSARELLKH